MTFAEWIGFEAERIVRIGLLAPEEHRSDYMIVQIQGALKKAYAHGKDGLSEHDAPRAVRRTPTSH
jgi:hypothetical protein